jgi:hypothetical protein
VPLVGGITFAPAEAGYWASQSHGSDVTPHQATGLLGWSQVRLQFSRTVPTGYVEDLAQMSLSFSKIVGGGEYAYVPTAELSTIEGHLDTFYTNIKDNISSQYTLVAYVWHHYNADLPRDKSGRGLKPGPAVRTTIKALPGSVATSRAPDQLTSTITWRTTSRRHWGRVYIPGIAASKFDTTYGRLTTATVDDLSAAGLTLHTATQTAGYQLVVASQLHPGVLTPTQIEVDDVPDIQRRRRAKRPSYRSIL